MEKVIDCPVCYNVDNCFEEIQETFSSYLCFACGFMSDSRYEVGSLQLIENLKKSPKLVQDTAFVDKNRNIVWFPSVINMGELGIIYPEGTPDKYVWRYAKVIKISDKEKAKYDNYDRRLDVDNAEKFKHFISACKAMGITRDIKQNA